MSNTPEQILDWNTQMLIKEAVLQNVSESKKINITQEMVNESKAKASDTLYQLMLNQVVREDIEYVKEKDNQEGLVRWNEDAELVNDILSMQRSTLAKLFNKEKE